MLDKIENNHKHNGVDAPQIKPKDLEGFPIYTSEVVHDTREGTIVLENIAGTIKLCAFLSGSWVKTTLT